MSSHSRQIILVKSAAKPDPKSSASEQLKKKLAKARSDLKRAQKKLELYKNCAALHNQRRHEIVLPEVARYYQNLKQWVLALVHAHQKFKWNAIEYDAIAEQIEDALSALARELSEDDEIAALVEQYSSSVGEEDEDEEEDDDLGEDDELFASEDAHHAKGGVGASHGRSPNVELFIDRVCMQFGLDPEVFVDCKTMDQVAYILHSQIGSRGHQESTQASTPREKKPTSIRELYRKLASILHPDKEHDVEVRAEKTELMKKLNNAYRDNDIETLMNMQMELTQSDLGDLVSDGEVLTLTLAHVKLQTAKLMQQAEEFASKMPRVQDIKKIKKLTDIENAVDDLIDGELSALIGDQVFMQNEIKYYFHSKKAMKPKVRLWVAGFDDMLG
jgi:hypothetical protein